MLDRQRDSPLFSSVRIEANHRGAIPESNPYESIRIHGETIRCLRARQANEQLPFADGSRLPVVRVTSDGAGGRVGVGEVAVVRGEAEAVGEVRPGNDL